jgi:hypothetical protein|tara:strand:+ start:7933 stop:8085 length:153 start_codon:yes stop_codon:yes gene_type:complete
MMNNASNHIRDVYLIVFTLGFISLVWLGALVVTGVLYLENIVKGNSSKGE